jgi:ribonuclease Y
MSTTVIVIVLAAVVSTIVLSLLIGTLLYKRKLKSRQVAAEDKSKLILKEAEIAAENLKKDRILEAKEKILKMRSEFEDEANKKKSLIISNEQKIKQREGTLNKEIENLKRKEAELDELKSDLANQLEHVKKRKEELDKFNQQKIQVLENISKLTADEAREQLVASLKDEAQTRASSFIKDIMEQAKLSATKEAKKIVVETIQRTATSRERLSAEKEEISALSKRQPEWRLSLTIRLKQSSSPVSIRFAAKSHDYRYIAWYRTEGFTLRASKKSWQRPPRTLKTKLLRSVSEP